LRTVTEKELPSLHPVVGPRLSVLVPIYNEVDSIAELCSQLLAVLRELSLSFEVIAVNDGSTDQSLQRLREQSKLHPEIKIVNFRRNYGQTAALMAAIDHSKGDILVAIDADLQNDPKDIPRLLAELDQGYDVVSGWRRDRKDAVISRNFVSYVANKLISLISGVHLSDYGCTLKAYRRDVIKDVRLYGEMHRFVPIYASMMGGKIIEIPVTHHARKFGQSKYGLERTVKVVLDLVVVRFLDRHFVKPMYIFGGFGIALLAVSGLSFLVMLCLKIFNDVSLIRTPLPLFTAFTFLLSFISILMGLLAEMIVRTYFESQNRAPYLVRDLINFDENT
jgi:glycosyltransferase involved in cell wall biosynthesis